MERRRLHPRTRHSGEKSLRGLAANFDNAQTSLGSVVFLLCIGSTHWPKSNRLTPSTNSPQAREGRHRMGSDGI
jgi:hypothetical protein